MFNKLLCFLLLLSVTNTLFAQKIDVTGSQISEIQYQLEQNIQLFPDLRELKISFVVPATFKSSTYSQEISGLDFQFSIKPKKEKTETDARGNTIKTFIWKTKKGGTLKSNISFLAKNQVRLSAINDLNVPFPVQNVPANLNPYLQATKQVQVDDPRIQKKAQELTANAKTVYQATQNILFWVVGHLNYVLKPTFYHAVYSYRTKKGNCQNYSHLAAALMRSVGIPVRIVNGITIKKPYSLDVNNREYRFEMAEGRHSWIEVYFPGEGWLPFDPQQTGFFVSNRYLRLEIGVDNKESVNDGLIRWRQKRGSDSQSPKLQEAYNAQFVRDDINLNGNMLGGNMDGIVLGPPLSSEKAMTVASVEKPKKPRRQEKKPPVAPKSNDYQDQSFRNAFSFGNTEFPENIDFTFTGKANVGATTEDESRLERNFLVETAEYVTSKSQYAQFFEIDKAIKLETISLALHNFGGSGQIWVVLSEDANGDPSFAAVPSARISTQNLRTPKGYQWVDFDFKNQGLVLSPGKYWIIFNYSEAPIVNWFYSYGKPTGPADGTRSRQAGQNGWPIVLNYEFNYRVSGKE